MVNYHQFSILPVTSDATDANVTNTDLLTGHSDSMLTKLAQPLDNSWQYCQDCIHILFSIAFAQR